MISRSPGRNGFQFKNFHSWAAFSYLELVIKTFIKCFGWKGFVFWVASLNLGVKVRWMKIYGEAESPRWQG